MLLQKQAIEKSTYVVNVAFMNELGQPVTPVSASWSLRDNKGNVINNREIVNITSPEVSEDILLTGNDLTLQPDEHERGERVLTIEATYNSSMGNILPMKEEFRFFVTNLIGVS